MPNYEDTNSNKKFMNVILVENGIGRDSRGGRAGSRVMGVHAVRIDENFARFGITKHRDKRLRPQRIAPDFQRHGDGIEALSEQNQ